MTRSWQDMRYIVYRITAYPPPYALYRIEDRFLLSVGMIPNVVLVATYPLPHALYRV